MLSLVEVNTITIIAQPYNRLNMSFSIEVIGQIIMLAGNHYVGRTVYMCIIMKVVLWLIYVLNCLSCSVIVLLQYRKTLYHMSTSLCHNMNMCHDIKGYKHKHEII